MRKSSRTISSIDVYKRQVFGLGGELMSILAYKTKERVEFVTPPKQSLLKDIEMCIRDRNY